MLFSWWSLYYVKGLCALKCCPCLCQCQFLAFIFPVFNLGWYTGPLYFASVNRFLGWRLFEWIQSKSTKVSAVRQMLSLSQLLRCVAMLVGPPCVNLTNPISDPGPSHQQAAKRLWICVSWGSLLHEAGNGPDLEKVLWGLCTLPVSWDKWFIKRQFIPCTCPENWFNFFCICMNYTLCASLLCENSKRWNKNKRQQKALQRIKKQAVCRWNSDHIIWVACSFV